MAKDIWKEMTGEDSDFKSVNIINKKEPYQLNIRTLRNYINISHADNISDKSLYEYYKDNLFEENDNRYISHLAMMIPNIPFEKRIKLLEACFKFVDPNLGTLTTENYNYFQCACLYSRFKSSAYNAEQITELYQLGIANGLDKAYLDINGQSNSHYYLSVCSPKVILQSYKDILCEEADCFDYIKPSIEKDEVGNEYEIEEVEPLSCEIMYERYSSSSLDESGLYSLYKKCPVFKTARDLYQTDGICRIYFSCLHNFRERDEFRNIIKYTKALKK